MPKKGIIAIILLLCVLCAFSVTAYAHSGDIDENGGHYVSGTGEYHYHHGYEAHNHYDMDGDGDKDCPYDFDDKTGQNSGNAGDSSTGNNKTHTKEKSHFDWVSLFTDTVPIILITTGTLLFFVGMIVSIFNEKVGTAIMRGFLLTIISCLASLLIGGIFWLFSLF